MDNGIFDCSCGLISSKCLGINSSRKTYKKSPLEFKCNIERILVNMEINKENRRGKPRAATTPGILKIKETHP